MINRILPLGILLCSTFTVFAQTAEQKFRQLGTELPTPNTYRTASGAPGHQYWQQKADYDISVTLNDENQSVKGKETITYFNNSPDELAYLWLQLDQNIFSKTSDTYSTETFDPNGMDRFDPVHFIRRREFEGGYQILGVADNKGKPLKYTINKTMMRIDLPKPLPSKGSFSFSVEWFNYINEIAKNGGRGGYEYFPADGNYLYEMAQWFPRMAVYSDVTGWQHKQYLGRGEFALPFGDYKVSITAPSDHLVTATGELTNAKKVLTSSQLNLLNKAASSDKVVVVHPQSDAESAEKSKAKGNKTWVFEAKNVRDFAWASSRKFIWDAMGVKVGNKQVMCMSFYPKEGNPLWGQYSTEVVAHTIKTYSKYTIDYPYPVAISVHGPVFGMEYPMICFNGGRPEADGTYPERTKFAMISVIIHEVGHNFFPMIINSDERQWSWMDEGLNSFVQYLTEVEWQPNYPSRYGEAYRIVPYMKSDKSAQTPIMANSESILQFGPNAYAKPACGLNILRETILGRELFDYAFKTYSQRWAFKHPEPADFFRTMEDASGVDLDWFWRGWFYGVDHVDLGIKGFSQVVSEFNEPNEVAKLAEESKERYNNTISEINNRKAGLKMQVDQRPQLKDFYNEYDENRVTAEKLEAYNKKMQALNDDEKRIFGKNYFVYQLDVQNLGGLVMPVILKLDFNDGTDSIVHIPVEIWRTKADEVTSILVSTKEVKGLELDPFLETADVELGNNYWPSRIIPNRYQRFKQNNARYPAASNPMRLQKPKQQ